MDPASESFNLDSSDPDTRIARLKAWFGCLGLDDTSETMKAMIKSAEHLKVFAVYNKFKARWETAHTIFEFLRVRATYHHGRYNHIMQQGFLAIHDYCVYEPYDTAQALQDCFDTRFKRLYYHNECAHVYVEAAKYLKGGLERLRDARNCAEANTKRVAGSFVNGRLADMETHRRQEYIDSLSRGENDKRQHLIQTMGGTNHDGTLTAMPRPTILRFLGVFDPAAL